MTLLKRVYHVLSECMFWVVVILYVTGLLKDWAEQHTYDPVFWKQAILYGALALMIATVCSIAQERK